MVLGLGDGAGGGEGGRLGAGVDGNCSSGIDASKKIRRRYPGSGSVYYSSGFRYLVGRLRKESKKKKRGGGEGFQEV